MSAELYECFIDGACRNNGSLDRPREAAAAAIIYYNKKEKIVAFARPLGELSNNQAEYEALIMCLTICRTLKIINPIIYSDSRVVVKQVNGDWEVKEKSLLPQYVSVKTLAEDYNFKLVWVPRKNVFLANDLCNKALNQLRAIKSKMVEENGEALFQDE